MPPSAFTVAKSHGGVVFCSMLLIVLSAAVANATCTLDQIRACNNKLSHNNCVATLERAPGHVIVHRPNKECARRQVNDCLEQCGGTAPRTKRPAKP
jgi:hypothetical protein